MKGQGFGDPHEDGFEELDTTANTIVRSPKLRIKSQHTQEVAPLEGAHN